MFTVSAESYTFCLLLHIIGWGWGIYFFLIVNESLKNSKTINVWLKPDVHPFLSKQLTHNIKVLPFTFLIYCFRKKDISRLNWLFIKYRGRCAWSVTVFSTQNLEKALGISCTLIVPSCYRTYSERTYSCLVFKHLQSEIGLHSEYHRQSSVILKVKLSHCWFWSFKWNLLTIIKTFKF